MKNINSLVQSIYYSVIKMFLFMLTIYLKFSQLKKDKTKFHLVFLGKSYQDFIPQQ